ncbi:hypothetical protein JX266_004127 [Neoarthrinium moseri]|nr:hypothetical protein JX266_004127 [Neoarthrinium moseri]
MNLLPIDPSLFPKLSTRRALLVVDAQNDFLSPDGALHVGDPADLTGRITQLVDEFRPYGDIVWIGSEYSQPRPAKNEQIITSDTPASGNRKTASRGRKPPPASGEQSLSRCPEAFLSGPAPGRPECVQKDTAGAEFPPEIQKLIEKKDMSFTKTHYSAFKVPSLIQRLRMKFVSEVFLCGSLTNISIMATAIDAGSHGLDIGIVEDCCGYRSSDRHSGALKKIQQTTGCDIMSTDEVLKLLKPKTKQLPATAPTPNPTGRRYPVVYEARPSSSGDQELSKSPPSSASSNVDSSPISPPLASEANAGLPPITFTRARTAAARGRPSRPLPDIEQRLNGQIAIMGNMHASPNDDLNASSGDDSHDDSTVKAPPAAQPQNGIGSRNKGKSSETRCNPKNEVGATKETGIESTLSRLNLGGDKGTRPLNVSVSPVNETAPLEHQTEPTTITSEPPKARSPPKPSNGPPNPNQDIGTKMEDRQLTSTTSEPLCEGDTKVHYNVLPEALAEGIFDKLREEVQWLRMSHQGGEVPRLVAVQGEVDESGNIPVYRHPADESPPLLPWTSTVKDIRDVVAEKVGHPLNHALIQFYRDGSDYISEHSDKTLDIAKGSFIVNVSLGAERTMVLRTKRPPKQHNDEQSQAETPTAAAQGTKREAQRARLPHNSMCQMGLQTNMRWLHAIRQDKRLDREKTEDELAYGGARISLTFRQIGTFLDRDQKLIWGQGAKAKTREEAREVINGQTPEAVEMLRAFGRENQSSDFDWDEYYGKGFDVLHIMAAHRLFTSSDAVANVRVQLMLTDLGIGYAKGSLAPVDMKPKSGDQPPAPSDTSNDPLIKFVDNGPGKSTVFGDMAIMLYLDRYYGKGAEGTAADRADTARWLTRFQQAIALGSGGLPADATTLRDRLTAWEKYAEEADFIAGHSISLADYAFWPLLYTTLGSTWRDDLAWAPNLKKYYERIRDREVVVKVFGKDKGASPKGTPKKSVSGTSNCEKETPP